MEWGPSALRLSMVRRPNPRGQPPPSPASIAAILPFGSRLDALREALTSYLDASASLKGPKARNGREARATG